MVNCNNLYERLEFEKSQINSANILYEKMGLTNVRRSTYHSDGGCENKHYRIDMICRDPNGKLIKVCEIFRSYDWDDMMLEYERDYGGCTKRMHYVVDYIFYHTPETLYIINWKSGELPDPVSRINQKSPYEHKEISQWICGQEVWTSRLAIMKWSEVNKYLKINKINKTCN